MKPTASKTKTTAVPGPESLRRLGRAVSMRRLGSGLVGALFCFLLMGGHSGAVDLTAELTAGYDSNPALTDPSEGSGFSVYGLRAAQPFGVTDDLNLDLSVEGRYQDYWSVGDNYRMQADGSLTYVLVDGRFLPSLMGEAAAYRDALIEADERNEAMVGIGADWIISRRLTLGLEQTCRWLSYLNWAMPFSGKGQGRQEVKGGKGGRRFSSASQPERGWDLSPRGPSPPINGNSPLDTLYPPRDNRLFATTLKLDVFILSSLTGRVYAAYGDLDASLDMESYREIQAGAALSWSPAPEWLAEVEAAWFRTDYHRVPQNITCVRRTNQIWSAGIQVSRFWGSVEVFGQAGWKSGDAPLDYESYTQTVIQCGLSYSF
ncbi:MAG: hypothetical protein QG552_3781 [Thermodesulfobacteriota bacterium]|nr:hypothetical protein [Thermodesulfobacteriota bacterium]